MLFPNCTPYLKEGQDIYAKFRYKIIIYARILVCIYANRPAG